MPDHTLYLTHRDLIEKLLAAAARRHFPWGDLGEEFVGWARLRLIEDDCAVLRKFGGRSKLSTFLTTVVAHLVLDFRDRHLGKWRPSAAARRHGRVGEALDRLIQRDGRTVEEAIAVLRDNHHVEESDARLREIAGSLPEHRPRRFEGAEALERQESAERTDRRAIEGEREADRRRLRGALKQALAALDPVDRLIVRWFDVEGLSARQVAPRLGLTQRQVFGRRDRALLALRRTLTAEGWRGEDLQDLLGEDAS